MNKEFLKQIYWRLPYKQRRILFKLNNPSEYRSLNNLRVNNPKKLNYPTFKPFLKYKCIFVHIPKTAGLSIGYGLFGRHTGNHTTIAEYQIAFNRKEFDSFFKFEFVRNTWDRILSSFIYLKNGGRNQVDFNWSEKYLSRFNNFDDFVTGWVNRENINIGIHFKPQYEFITLPTKLKHKVDFIGFYENISDDFNYIRNQLGIGKKLEFINKTRNKQKDYRFYYNDKIREIVADVYREDIEFFGYDFENAFLERKLINRCP